MGKPLKMSETIYEGFEKMGKKQNKEQVPPAPPPEQQQKSSAGKQPKKSPANGAGQKPAQFKSLEEALKALDVSELQQQLEKSQNLFPENPSVWVKDLAGYLNYKLQAPEMEPTLSNHSYDYPFCVVSKELRSTIKSLLGRCSDTLPDFFDHCIYTMLRELDKPAGEPLHGYRICIQAILLDKPKIATLNLANYLELLRSHQNRPVKLWLGIMLPVLGIKTLSSYAIAYLERLLILQEQLRRLYPRLKVLAFGAKPECTLHTYFPSFLSRATPHCPDEMKRELLNSMTECLSLDPQSLGVWRQLYTKHLSQSSLLLDSLFKSWNTLPPKLRKNLQETIQSFKMTNEEMKSSGSSQEVMECNALCSYLQNSGLMPVFQQAWSHISHYSQKGISWLEKNAPYYYSEAVTTVGPVLEVVWEKTKIVFAFIAEQCSDLILWVKENAPRFVEWLNANIPESVFHFAEYLKELLLFIHQNYVLPVVMYIKVSLEQAWKNFVDSCNGEVSLPCVQNHVISITNSTWTFLQDTTLAIKNWAVEL
ncbi:transmembrane protein 214-A-like, partial [Scleropages formosus]